MTLSIRTLWLCLLLALAGCGDDDDDDVGGDGDADADADGDGDADGARAFVVTSDFTSSVYGWAPLASPADFTDLGPAEGDAIAVDTAGRIVLIEATLGAVTILGPDLSIEQNFSVADDEGDVAPNPHSIAIVSDTKAYVARFGQGTIAIVDLATGEITGTIDLSAHDPDLVPDMDAMVIAGDKVLVTLERLDAFVPRGESEIVVIDIATDAETATLALPFANPYGRFRAHGTTGELLVACPGNFAATDGGIVGLGPDADAPHTVITEAALGGDVGSFVIADGTHGFAIVAIDAITHLVPFDASTGEAGEHLIVSEGYDLRDVELVGDALMVADGAAAAPGLRVFSMDGTERTAEPAGVGLPPTMILAL